MSLAADAADFQAAPIGKFLFGRSWAVWCATPEIIGSFHWGLPDDHDAAEMMAAMDFVRHPSLAGRAKILMDSHQIQRVDADTLLAFTKLARQWIPIWSPFIARHATIVPDSLVGILLAGVLPLLGGGYSFKFVHELSDALVFLDDPEVSAAYRDAHAIADTRRLPPAALVKLKDALGRDLGNATIGDCALAMGLSTRTLQRELRRHGTSFSDELRRARTHAASELLRMSELKIDAIAARVGFGTASRMSAALRREVGATASEIRARRV
jgi:AraC-like DNA-binding protein